jgi:hypothetical protein
MGAKPMTRPRSVVFRHNGRQRRGFYEKHFEYYRPVLERLEDRLAPSVNVFGYHNNIAGNGENLSETSLTPANVNVNTFGKVFTTKVDGMVYAQPLYVSDVNITAGDNKGIHDVLYVATEHDSLYAIDGGTGHVLWQVSFINPAAGITSCPSPDANSTDLVPEIGITGTPVIDPFTNTLFLDAKTKEVRGGVNHYVYRLHAVDLGSGAEKQAPATIADTVFDGTTFTYVSGPFVFGTGDGNVGGKLTFNALRQLQRPGLTVIKGNVFLAFGSHNDTNPYHGWLLSYSEHNLQLNGVFCTSPNGSRGGIWQSGGRITSDAQGNIFVISGNGTFDTTLTGAGFPNKGDYGDAFLKLAFDPTTNSTHQSATGWGLKVVDYFTPFNQAALSITDKDLGSSGPVLLPDSVGSTAHPHLLLGTGKEGKIYLIDRDNMGKFDPNTDHVVQENVVLTSTLDTAAYLAGTFYYACHDLPGEAFSILHGAFNPVPTSKTPDLFSYPGSTPSISANVSNNRIVWLIDTHSNQLRAYDARNLGVELYTSAQAANGRDRLNPPTKFAVPTIADGRVYVGTQKNVIVAYGLLHPPTESLLAVSPGTGAGSTPRGTATDRRSPTSSGLNQGAVSSLAGDSSTRLSVISPLAAFGVDGFFASSSGPEHARTLAGALAKARSTLDWLEDAT